MKRLLGAAALLLATPLAAQPANDADALYAKGVAARLAGDSTGAIAALERVVAERPQDSDAWLQLGLSYLLANRLDDAERALRETLRIAPQYQDARIGLARVAIRRGDTRGAQAMLDEVLVADPGNADALSLKADLERWKAGEDGHRWRADLELSYSDLDKPQSDWREAALRLGYRVSPDLRLNGSLEHSRRFGLDDDYLEAGATVKLTKGFIVQAAVGGTPSADFRPKWQVSLGLNVELRGGHEATQVTLDLRQSRFRSGDIQTVSPGVVQYLADGRVWLSGRWINIFDERGKRRDGWLGRGDVMVSEKARLFAGYAHAPDTSEGVVIDTKTVFGGAAFDIGDRFVLSLSVAHEARSTGIDRTQFSTGLGVKF